MVDTIPAQQFKELFVLAKNPTEMAEANTALVHWCDGRLASLELERAEMQDAHDQAVKAKWRAKPLRNQVLAIEKRVRFYTKVKAALVAGFSVIPNFPIDLFAIRTTKTLPTPQRRTQYGYEPSLRPEESNLPALAEGRYVSDRPSQRTYQNEADDGKGGKRTQYLVETTNLEDVDFPVAFAKPAIMEATREAMALKCFDEIGIFKDSAYSTRTGDPMVIGRIRVRTVGGQERALSFAIAWFLNTANI